MVSLEGSFVDSAQPSYQRHRYPVEVIAHCVRLYHRFPLSFREVEEADTRLERGVIVSHDGPPLVPEIRVRAHVTRADDLAGGPGLRFWRYALACETTWPTPRVRSATWARRPGPWSPVRYTETWATATSTQSPPSDPL
ncbi:hypothetical protein SHIRM173S_12574 [Streptomyces hirsutus]